MSDLCRFVRLLMVATFLVSGLSSQAAFGADKTFTLNMAVTPPAMSPAAVTATFTNQGNSSFNSLDPGRSRRT